MPLISIIVPVFNTEQYIDRCIESIVNQTFKNLEIILVNDGSSDSSGVMCDEWSKKDTRIRVVHKKNEGVTIARKTGVKYATGEWIFFIDSDDYLPANAIHALYSHTRDDVDIISGAFEYRGSYPLSYDCFGEMDNVQYLKNLLKHKISWGPVARLIRTSLFDAFTFDIPAAITTGEDFIMNLRLGQKVQRIILLPDIVYYYIWRPGSAISNKSHILDKNCRVIFNRTFNQSILPQYRKLLKVTIICFWIDRYRTVLKAMIKNVIYR